MRPVRAVLSVAALTATTVAMAVPAGAAPVAARAGARTAATRSAASSAAVLRGSGASPLVREGVRPVDLGHAVPLPAQPANPRLHAAAVAQPANSRGTVRVLVTGTASSVRRQVGAVGGHVLVSAQGVSSVVIAKSRLTALAARPGITSVDAADRPVTDDAGPGPSQAVPLSGADTWHTAGQDGTGVKIGIVDVGFGSTADEYSTELAAGHLGTDPQLINEDCTDENNVSTPYDDPHGLAVAELASQQAPGAQLFLYCVNTKAGVAATEAAMHSAGITIATSSLAWYRDGRGDGTGIAGSVAATVKKARQDGILWFNSAGNEVPQHWGGALTDVDHDGVIDMGNHSENVYPYESNFYYTAPGSTAAPTSLFWQYQWDAWPTTTDRAQLSAFGVQCRKPFGSGGIDNCQGLDLGPVSAVSSTGTHSPAVTLDTSAHPNTWHYVQIWQVQISYVGKHFPVGRRYDLFGGGDAGFASDLACPTVDAESHCVFSVGAKAQSLTSPANSPYAVAVGAVNSGADGKPRALQYFSSQGPTIDGRIKPELLGWDGVSSYVSEFSDGFYGTSAASPVVAGSAALVAGANPGLDGAQILNLLEQRAHSGNPTNPPSTASGYGQLTLGSPSTVAAPPGARYQPIAPVRVLDTRSSVGGHRARLGPGGTLTLSLPALPDDATAVAINLTGVGANAPTYLSAYTGGTANPGTSNLNLTPGTDVTAAVFAVVTVRNKSITIRNSAGTVDVLVDELGYFGTGEEPGRYTTLATPKRVLANAGTAPHQQRIVDPGLPAGATAAVVNVTTAATTASGYVSAAPQCTGSVSTVNFARYARANLAFVTLDPNGHFCVTNGPSPAHVYVDVLGYISDSGAEYIALPSAQRIVDTRTGNGGSAGGRATRPISGGASPTQFYAAGVGDVPAAATALLTGAVEAGNDRGGYLSMFPGVTPPATSTLNYTPGRIVANASVVGLTSSHTFGVYASQGSTQVAVDLFGYFLPPTGCQVNARC